MTTNLPTSCVVTGAASGIGLAIARELLGSRRAVVGIDVDGERLEEAATLLQKLGDFVPLEADVALPETHELAADAAEERAQLGLWVNNAGYNVVASIHEIDQTTYERGMAVNFGGVFWGTATAVRRLLATGGGSIVNMSSAQARFGFRGFPAYAAAKGAIISLTRQVAAEYADRGIRCNAVAPGLIAGPMNEQLIAADPDPESFRRSLDELCPIGRWGTPEDIAKTVRFLGSDDASFITGQVIVVDGGHDVVPSNHFRYQP